MVGYVSDTSVGTNDLSSQIKNVETSPFHFCGDISDTILDFDSIKEWIEDFSDTELVSSDKLVEMDPTDLYSAGGSVNVSAFEGDDLDGELRNQSVPSTTPCLPPSGFPPHIDGEFISGGEGCKHEDRLCHPHKEILNDGVPPGDYTVEKCVDNTTIFLHGSFVKEENSTYSDPNGDVSSSEPCSSGDNDDDARPGKKGLKNSVQGDDELEEGEIRELEAEKMTEVAEAESDDDDDDDGGGGGGLYVPAGPIRSKNEVNVLPPVPRVDVSLRQHQRLIHVGVVLSIIDGDRVIVEGAENHGPLDEGSVLWITEARAPLGYVDEIFGPVKSPYYVVRFNSGHEVPPEAVEGAMVSYAEEFALHVLGDESLYRKGYDASGDNDEELSEDLDFSDDEEEAEHGRSVKGRAVAAGNRHAGLSELSRAAASECPPVPPGTWSDRSRARSVSNRHRPSTVRFQHRPLLTGMPCQQRQGHSSRVHQQSTRSFAGAHLVPAQQQLPAEMPAQQPAGYPVQTQMQLMTGQTVMAVHAGEMPPVHLIPAQQPPGQLFPVQQQLLGPVPAVQFFSGGQQQHFLQTYSCTVQSQQQLVHLVHPGSLPSQQPFCQVALPAQQPFHLMFPFGMPAQQTLPAPVPSWQQVPPAVVPAQPQQPGPGFPFGLSLPAHHPLPGQPLPVSMSHHHQQPGQPLLHACTPPALMPAGMQHQPGRAFFPAAIQPPPQHMPVQVPHQHMHAGIQAPHRHMHAVPAVMPPQQQQPADMQAQQYPDHASLPGVRPSNQQAEQVKGEDSVHASKVYHRGALSRRGDILFHRGAHGGARFKRT